MTSSGSAEESGGNYTNSLDVIPADVPYRPPQPHRPSMPGPETATVVGPAGEEIHTDRHGRIKVQFHWDRQGQNDEHSSAWIRVAQGWAGTGWGFVFIPRIGMEVIVSFLGGDPDRPVVTGCLYNGTHPPPYTLPDEKTKSTIKTNSSLGGGGSNELRFEDKKGSEEVYIHAEKDFNEVVEHNHSTRVKNCQTNTVDVDQTETIHGEQTITVHKDRTKILKANENVFVDGMRTETVKLTETLILEDSRQTTISFDETLTIERDREMRVTGKDTEVITGGRTTIIKGSADELYVQDGQSRVTHVDGQFQTKVAGKYQLVQGDSEKFILNGEGWWESAKQIKVLVAGKAANIKMSDSGNIEIGATSEIVIHVNKSSYIKISDSGIEIAGPTIKINATAGTTEIDAATQVKIKC
jgi:type VI secretion system secreted protein VgrG